MMNIWESSNAVFLLSQAPCPQLSRHYTFPGERGDRLVISVSTHTPYHESRRDPISIAIIGICVDAHGLIEEEKIADYLSENTKNIEELIAETRRFAGKYVIVACYEGRLYVLGDAVSALSIYYLASEKELCVASHESLIADLYELKKKEKSQAILKQSVLEMTLPNDVGNYDAVLFLLPNHYFDGASLSARRFYPAANQNVRITDDAADVVANTMWLTGNILKAYAKHGEFVVGLTAGWDSRLVVALVLHNAQVPTCYTSIMPDWDKHKADAYIPKILAEQFSFPYQQIEDIELPNELKPAFLEARGSLIASNTAYTHTQFFPGKARLGTSIIDQVGKSLIGNALPERHGTTLFFMLKLHSYSPLAREEIRTWRDGIKRLNSNISIYDLFAWENRCGRWANLYDETFSIAGVCSLNVFNCREIIESWVTISRKTRVAEGIHIPIFQQIDRRFLEIPINPGSPMLGSIKKSPLLFLLSSYAKYGYLGLKQILKKS